MSGRWGHLALASFAALALLVAGCAHPVMPANGARTKPSPSPTATPTPSDSPTLPPSPTPQPEPEPEPTVAPDVARDSAHLKSFSCQKRWLLPKGAVVVAAPWTGAPYDYRGELNRISYKNGHIDPLPKRKWLIDHPRMTIDVVADPRARLATAYGSHQRMGIVIQRAWTEAPRIGIWTCS